jgi:hypothetical protein
MKTNRKISTAAMTAATLAAALTASSVPVFARAGEGLVPVRYLSRGSAHAYQRSQSQDIYQSNAQGHQSYSNPDRDYFSGLNATNPD